jgi:FkbM family methyltransferase
MGTMSLVGRLARWLPSGRLRNYCRNFIETELKGYPQAAVKYRSSELSLNLDMVLSHYRVSHPLIRYMQVGTFDGVSGDPIYPLIEKHGLQGVLVEPQREAFERLKTNYARFDPAAFVLVNAAIAARDGTAVLYTIKPGSKGPEWLRQIASFDRSVVMKHAPVVPDLESFIESEEVRCMTFTTLFTEVGIHHIDLLQVDAEGYDAEILRLFDIPSRKPAIVRFEHKHLSLADHERSIGALVDVGYRFTICGENTLAYLQPD